MNATEGAQGKVSILQPSKTLDFKPKRSCRRCNGTGRLGYLNGDKNQAVPCSCILKQVRALQAKQEVDKDTKITVTPEGSAGPAGDTSERK